MFEPIVPPEKKVYRCKQCGCKFTGEYLLMAIGCPRCGHGEYKDITNTEEGRQYVETH